MAYDLIVVGLGAMGGAAAYHAAMRQARVLGLDANPEGHELGSSHGATRATRTAYFEAPEYVPLVQRAHEHWRNLEKETGHNLFTMTGALYLGTPGNPLTAGVIRAAREHGLMHDVLAGAPFARRFPGFALPEGWEAVWEAGGGIFRADQCLKAHTDAARRHGADLRYATPALAWRRDGNGIAVDTPDGTFRASAMILTPGPWAPQALADLNLPLTCRRIVVSHVDALDPTMYPASDFSVYFWMTPEGIFAGFPHLDGEGVKVMRHDRGEDGSPETVRRSISDEDNAQTSRFLAKYMPAANGSVRRALTCLYTMTPDNHFILDRHPVIPGLVYGCGFCGHGFKFAPVIGEALSDMALEGTTGLPIGFLAADRFARMSAA
ncbi:MAG: N-methyl-L-tryptophan oxidase [Alphaproteobacteria bacterium]|nr:N-methyl-L-tryptophan oxidase [Alphaproteobacteria bacterium]